MTDPADAVAQRVPPPPYVAFPLFMEVVGTMRDRPWPARVERELPDGLSDVAIRQLVIAFRFFDLVDGKDKTTEALANFAASVDTPDWPSRLADVLSHKYAPLIGPEMERATAEQFETCFATHYAAKGDTLRKAISFFVTAASEAGLDISSTLTKNRKPRRRKALFSIDPQRLATDPLRDSPDTEASEPRDMEPVMVAVHPLLAAHLGMIPRDPKKGWVGDKRLKWFRAFAANVSQVYDEDASVDFKIDLVTPAGN